MVHMVFQVDSNGDITGMIKNDVSNGTTKTTWSTIAKLGSTVTNSSKLNYINPEVRMHDDNFVKIALPRDFLVNARKWWNTSYISHFVGGNFSFKFVYDLVWNYGVIMVLRMCSASPRVTIPFFLKQMKIWNKFCTWTRSRLEGNICT